MILLRPWQVEVSVLEDGCLPWVVRKKKKRPCFLCLALVNPLRPAHLRPVLASLHLTVTSSNSSSLPPPSTVNSSGLAKLSARFRLLWVPSVLTAASTTLRP